MGARYLTERRRLVIGKPPLHLLDPTRECNDDVCQFGFQAGASHDDIWAVREEGDWFHKVDRQPVQLTSGPLNFDAAQPSLDGEKIFAVGAVAG